MAGLKQIKTKIQSVVKTQKVTKAMEAVSAAKMRKAQQKALLGRAYARAAAATLSRVSGSRELSTHPLTAVREVGSALYIVITSDKGLAGALNSGVLRATLADIAARGLSQKNTRIVAVGRKASDFFSNRGFKIETYHPNNDVMTASLLNEIVAETASRFASGETDVVRIVYQNFISTFEQRATLRTLFPLSLEELTAVVGDIAPAKGVYAPSSGRDIDHKVSTYTVEPSEEEVLAVILPKLAGVIVYHALLESQASEHSARMVSMKSASDKAEEMTHGLTLKFNKARQAAITREVSEIIGGMEAMSV